MTMSPERVLTIAILAVILLVLLDRFRVFS